MRKPIYARLLGLLTAMVCVLSAGAAEDPQGGAAPPRGGREWKVLYQAMRSRYDVIGLAENLFSDISDKQKGRLKTLRAKQNEEAAQFQTRLAEKYAGRVARELTIPQRATFRSAEKVLDSLAKTVRLEGEKLIRIAGPEARARTSLETGRVETSDLLVYIGLDAEVHSQVRQLEREMWSSISDAMCEFVKVTSADTPKGEANKIYVEQYRRLQVKMRAQYVAERNDLLTVKQFEKLRRVEAAAKAYKKAIDLAYSAAATELRKLMK